VFDAPNRESCIVNRSRTNTPLQALVGMNGVQFVEASRNMAQRVMLAKRTDDERARFAFLLATGRIPSDQEARIIVDTFKKQQAEFKSDVAQAEKLMKVGESARDETFGVADHAAWTMVCNMLLNLDEAVTQH
jgi:hypothetical protein